MPETFHAPFSGYGPVFIMTRAASGFGLGPRSVGLFGRQLKHPTAREKKPSGTQGTCTLDLITIVIILHVSTNPLEM